MTNNLTKILGIGTLALTLAGCGEPRTTTTKYPVEDLLANHNGWSVFYTQGEKNEVVEKRFYSYNHAVRVFRDLEDNQPRYAQETLTETTCSGNTYTVEIHIRKNDRIEAGFDSTGGKHPQDTRRKAIKLEDSTEESR